ncbi:uncharacterized protein LOC143933651 [Lithobates pipiens]
MEPVFQISNESRLNYKVPKGKPLHQVWNSLWEQCEEANEGSSSPKACFPKANKKVMLANIMKMLAVFQSEVKERSSSSNSEIKTPDVDLCENCGSSKSKEKLLEENYKRRGEIIEYLLSSTAPLGTNEGLKKQTFQSHLYNEDISVEKSNGTKEYSTIKGTSAIAATQRPEVAAIPLIQPVSLATKSPSNLAFHFFNLKEDREERKQRGTNIHIPNLENTSQLSRYSSSREHTSKENTTRTLANFLKNFTKYDPGKDPFTNMFVFESECSQHNLGPRESCLMMKLWLPSQIAARLSAPVASPAGGPQFWSNDHYWGDSLDRVKALTQLVTGEDNLGADILEDLKVTPQDDPWEFARKFEQAYRLVMDVQDPKPPPTLLRALVNKFTYVDRVTHKAASKEKTIEGIVKLVDSYHRDSGLKAAPLWKNEVKPIRDVLMKDSIPKDEQPIRWRNQTHNPQCSCSCNCENKEETDIESAHVLNDHENSVSLSTVASLHNNHMQSQRI